MFGRNKHRNKHKVFEEGFATGFNWGESVAYATIRMVLAGSTALLRRRWPPKYLQMQALRVDSRNLGDHEGVMTICMDCGEQTSNGNVRCDRCTDKELAAIPTASTDHPALCRSACSTNRTLPHEQR